MKAANTIDTTGVAGLYDLEGPVLSAYFSRSEPGADDVALRRRRMLSRVAELDAGPAAADALAAALADSGPGWGTLAVFVGSDGQARVFPMPGAAAGDQVWCCAVPRLTPLLEWRGQRPPFVLAVVDRAGADVTVHPGGAAEPTVIEVTGPDDVIERNAPGGWSQHRYQNRAEDSWLHNAERVAEVVTDRLTAAGAGLLIVSGDVRAVAYLEERLPAGVRKQVTLKSIVGGRSADGSQEDRGAAAGLAVREFAGEQDAAAVGRIVAASGPGGLGVQGVAPTVHALARGRVETLVAAAALGPEGAPRRIWFGTDPTAIAEHRTGAGSGDGEARRGPTVDVLIRSAILTGAEVRVLPQVTALAGLRHGVGALCRFAEPGR